MAQTYHWLPIYLWAPRDTDPISISFETYGREVRFSVPRSEIIVVPGHNGVAGKVRVLVNGKGTREGFVLITIAAALGPRTEELPEKRLSEFP